MFRRHDRERYRLYFVTDQHLTRGRSTEAVVGEAILNGVTIVQLRDKGKTTRELLTTGERLLALTSAVGCPLLVNDRVDIALALDCQGVHLGQDDMPIAIARRLLGPDKIVGISIRSIEEAIAAQDQGADYVAVNGIFHTATKSDLGIPLGLDFVRQLRNCVTLPIIGIGGITVDNTTAVISAGCDGVAVVSGISQADDIGGSCRAYLARIKNCLVS